MPKRTLRQKLLSQREAVPVEERAFADLRAQNNVLALQAFLAAESIAAYISVRNETDTGIIIAAIRHAGKRLLLPSVSGEEMCFRELSPGRKLVKGCFGIPEPPKDSPRISASEADMIIVPGVSFDLSGRRLGYGRGYYDRYLHDMEGSGKMYGFCYDFQLVAEIVDESHDVLMDWVITDRRVIGPLRRP